MSEEQSAGGIRVERHSARIRPIEPAAPGGNMQRIVQHVTRYIGVPEKVYHEVESDLVHLDVLVVYPEEGRDYWTLVTSGMSDLPMNTPEGLEEQRYAELMICLPRSWKLPVDKEDWAGTGEEVYWPIYWLKTLARMPHALETWLGEGHTVPNGDPPEPYAKGTKLCCAMLMTPSIAAEGFGELEIDAEKKVHFYAVVPIYKEEMALKLKQGTAALIEKLHSAGVNEVLGVKRKNVGKKKWGIF
jgi:hypothetical protein